MGGGRAGLAVAAVAAGAGAGSGSGRRDSAAANARRPPVEWWDGLALLVEGGGLDLLLGPARQVHLHPDTLLLPPELENKELKW